VHGQKAAGTNKQQEPERGAERLNGAPTGLPFPLPLGVFLTLAVGFDPGRQSLISRIDLLRFFLRSALVGMMFLHELATLALYVRLCKAAVFRKLKRSRVLKKLRAGVTFSHNNDPCESSRHYKLYVTICQQR
jgi:hypothetical protein